MDITVDSTFGTIEFKPENAAERRQVEAIAAELEGAGADVNIHQQWTVQGVRLPFKKKMS